MGMIRKEAHMLRGLFLTTLLVAGVAFVAAAGDSGSANAESGRQLYAENCAACHGRYGEGDGPVSGALMVTPPDLTQLAARNSGKFPGAVVADYIDGRKTVAAHGTRSMPVWGMEFWLQAGADKAAEAKIKKKIDALVGYIAGIQD
jgi:mono/diheme cytochrome c family protein